MSSLFQLLPLEILDMMCSFLKAEDILMLRETLPMIRHCPRYKKLINKTRCFITKLNPNLVYPPSNDQVFRTHSVSFNNNLLLLFG